MAKIIMWFGFIVKVTKDRYRYVKADYTAALLDEVKQRKAQLTPW